MQVCWLLFHSGTGFVQCLSRLLAVAEWGMLAHKVSVRTDHQMDEECVAVLSISSDCKFRLSGQIRYIAGCKDHSLCAAEQSLQTPRPAQRILCTGLHITGKRLPRPQVCYV